MTFVLHGIDVGGTAIVAGGEGHAQFIGVIIDLGGGRRREGQSPMFFFEIKGHGPICFVVVMVVDRGPLARGFNGGDRILHMNIHWLCEDVRQAGGDGKFRVGGEGGVSFEALSFG